ncbi:frataxin-like protein [Dinothrombium tinctorium]|uniref:ferroxidase n=1 Tax=Dinothrombium tinctorium TaxID=1965070 RepID=A0A3S3NHR9_9ACAR|nr:frataxin-like protein [Dinothrombium tinctorium]RWS00721.1 frataxin-like protein [Dinothrombium tinctorium]RWS01009.1 frataxin-like protein [Dinothrombium tinctorium]RWS01942.1 frataxin-like protein [Dinothrombium tinctorium]
MIARSVRVLRLFSPKLHRFRVQNSRHLIVCLHKYFANDSLLRISPPNAAIKVCVRTLNSNSSDFELDLVTYCSVSDETLESLSEAFEEILEKQSKIDDFDVSLSSGVLTVNLGKYGTYVINKQTPNKQIWLSSPRSGPKRYDYVNGRWVYKRDKVSLHVLLSREMSDLFDTNIDFTCCSYGK